MRKIAYLFFCMLLSAAAMAQQRLVTGTVTNNNNQPVSGASVTVKGTSIGTQTDTTGAFRINVPAGSNTLVFSYVGLIAKEVPIGSQTQVLVSLAAASNINEVVVVGYTTQRKQDLTGAVAVVELTPAVKNNTSGNTLQALQGRVAGLYIEKDGSPNGSNSRILIRGANTLGNTNPLYIIDGIPTTRPEVFQNLSPATIASVQILKDASSESIYGSRASNGVIIVTTRNGSNSNGKVVFQFNSSVSAQSEKSSRFKVLNSIDRGKTLWRASVNDGVEPSDGYGEIYNFDWNHNFANPVLNSVTLKPFVGGDPNTPAGNTDWQSVVYKTGIVTNNNLTVSGGNRTSSFELNLAQFKNNGMLRYTNYERLNGSLNAITHSFNDKATFGVNLRISNSNERLTTNDLGGSPVTALAINLVPTIPVYQKDGVTFAGELGAGYSDRNNPLHMQYLARWNNANRFNTFGNVFAEIQPVKNLFFRSNFGVDNATYLSKVISPTFTEGALSRTTNSLGYDGNHYLSTTFSNTVRYNWDLNDQNHFKFLAGTEYIKTRIDYSTILKTGYAIQTQEYFTLNTGTGNTSASGYGTGNQLFSQFGRVDYSYGDKYLAALTVRRDGSSRFGANKQYGYFPAASVGWKIDKEAFMQNSRLFSELKVRAGIGRVGNQEVGDVNNITLFVPQYGQTLYDLTRIGFFEQYYNLGTAYSISGANTGTLPSGFVQKQLGNPDLRWETTDEINAGVDFALLKNSFYGSVDYFARKTTGILITPPVPAVLGEGKTKTVNGASKSNKGWEVILGYQNQTRSGIRYDVKLNGAHFRDKVTELPESSRPAYPGNPGNTILGHSQFDIFGYKSLGIFQSADEVAKAPTQIGAGPGRIRYADLNGDGKIDYLDQDWIATQLPKLEYGIRIDLGYKNFDFALFGSGVAGRRGYDAYTFINNLMRSRENGGPGLFDAWTPQNTNTKVPALTLKDNNNETRTSDYFIVNTSYFKMRNVQLGYTLRPGKVFTRMRFFAMAENLFWFKSKQYEGPDPERIDVVPVPIPKTFTLGLNASF